MDKKLQAFQRMCDVPMCYLNTLYLPSSAARRGLHAAMAAAAGFSAPVF